MAQNVSQCYLLFFFVLHFLGKVVEQNNKCLFAEHLFLSLEFA